MYVASPATCMSSYGLIAKEDGHWANNKLRTAVETSKMAFTDSKAPLRSVKRVQFGILAPDEIVSVLVKCSIGIWYD